MIMKTFRDLGISLPGTLTKNQSIWMPAILNRNNVFISDTTGTGKSFGFAVCAAHQQKSIIVCPTRELVSQYYRWIRDWSKDTILTDTDECWSDRRVLITTPIRLVDMIGAGFSLSKFKRLYVDEFDRIMDIRQDHKKVGRKLFQALRGWKGQYVMGTASPPVLHSINRYKIPDIKVFDFGMTLPATIDHYCYCFDGKEWTTIIDTTQQIDEPVLDTEKMALLEDHDQILDHIPSLISDNEKVLMFVPTTVSLSSLVERLRDRGVRADQLMNQYNYTAENVDIFNTYNVLCAKDYGSRGLDLTLDTVVILGSLGALSYKHCAGRVGRFGRKGKVITLLSGASHVDSYVRGIVSLIPMNP